MPDLFDDVEAIDEQQRKALRARGWWQCGGYDACGRICWRSPSGAIVSEREAFVALERERTREAS